MRLAGALKRLRSWFIDCSHLTTRNSTSTIFLRFLIPAKSATCSDSPRRRILTFWISAQMRQKDWGLLGGYVRVCSWRSVSSHSGSLSVPGWPLTSLVREGPLPNARQLLVSDAKTDGSLARFQSAAVLFSGKLVSQAQSGKGARKGCSPLLTCVPVDSASACVRNGIASEGHAGNGGGKGRGRPYGGKFMRRRRSWKRGSERRRQMASVCLY